MRIIAGKYRGRKLKEPESELIRPTTDMVKQGLFTKLQFFVGEKRVLDLFAGSGALGIEAISRGAKEVVFVDKSLDGVKLVKENLSNVGESAEVINNGYEKFLKEDMRVFDLILIDPPYRSEYYADAMELICRNDKLSDCGIIVCEHERGYEIKQNFFELFDVKNYGTKVLSYYRKKDED